MKEIKDCREEGETSEYIMEIIKHGLLKMLYIEEEEEVEITL